MPSQPYITREKNYCDLLYAWIQCNSERVGFDVVDRRIEKKKVKWMAIERDLIRVDPETGEEIKIMNRKTIAKYFAYLVEQGLIIDDKDDEYYYLRVLGREDANLIEYHTLCKLMHSIQRNGISMYIYLFNRYYANGCEPFIATYKQIKDFIGIATSTTSNNIELADMLEILERLGLLKKDKEPVFIEGKQCMKFIWVKNKLPDF